MSFSSNISLDFLIELSQVRKRALTGCQFDDSQSRYSQNNAKSNQYLSQCTVMFKITIR